MLLTKKPWPIVFLALVLLTGVLISSVQTFKKGSAAYLFAYPLVLMELTRQSMAAESPLETHANHLTHIQLFPDHTFRTVVRPNDDTLYSIAWFDLTDEPMVITSPKSDRYYVLPFMDAWTNVFATIGTRTTGNESGQYLLTGPNWKGIAPDNVPVINSPTNMAWMIGRIQTNGKADVENVAAIQKQIAITPLSKLATGTANPFVEYNNVASNPTSRNPKQEVADLSTTDFFNLATKLLAKQPAHERDAAALKNLEDFGVIAGKEFNMSNLGLIQQNLIDTAISITKDKMQSALNNHDVNFEENGWNVWRDTLGNYKDNYPVRAGIALGGLGALPASEAVYANTSKTLDNELLSGKQSYKMHFPKDQLPPVNAFWSITMYDTEGFMIDNAIKRYVIGDRDPLVYNEDGSLDIYIQHTSPTGKESNWLPAPADNFTVLTRLYYVKDSFLSGEWKIPAIETIQSSI